MSYNPYEDVSIDNPLPCKEVDGTYTRGEDVSEANPWPVMVVDVDVYTKFEDVSEDNPQPIALDTGATYTRFEDLSDTNRKPVVIVEGQSYDPKQPISMTNPWPVIDTGGGGGGGYTGPLDLVPGAVVAYGVRALSAAWLGQNIFRLRRDSDDAEMDFAADAVTGDAPVASITTWLNGANGFVKTWYDQSGNANNASQTTGALQPVYIASFSNSKPALLSTLLAAPFMTTGQNFDCSGGIYSVFAVSQINEALSIGCLFGCNSEGDGTNSYINFILSDSTDQSGIQMNLALDNEGASGDGFPGPLWETNGNVNGNVLVPFVVDIQTDLNVGSAHLSGAVLAIQNDNTSDAPGGSPAFPLTLFADDASSPFFNFPGSLAELLIYTSVIGSSPSTNIRTNMGTYYGITLS